MAVFATATGGRRRGGGIKEGREGRILFLVSRGRRSRGRSEARARASHLVNRRHRRESPFGKSDHGNERTPSDGQLMDCPIRRQTQCFARLYENEQWHSPNLTAVFISLHSARGCQIRPLKNRCGSEKEEEDAVLWPRQQTLTRGRRPNGFLTLSLKDRTILFLVILLDKTVSVGSDSLSIKTLA